MSKHVGVKIRVKFRLILRLFAAALVLLHFMVLQLTLISMFLGFKCFVLHILLKHSAALYSIRLGLYSYGSCFICSDADGCYSLP
jgi:hypothetical protein